MFENVAEHEHVARFELRPKRVAADVRTPKQHELDVKFVAEIVRDERGRRRSQRMTTQVHLMIFVSFQRLV
jgi:hypothetical protein